MSRTISANDPASIFCIARARWVSTVFWLTWSTTNANHPFYAAIQSDFVLWVKVNIVEAVAEFFTQAVGTTEQMLLVKSDILKRISQIKLAEMDEPATAARKADVEESA
jgi:hypothetical protein